MEQGREKEGLLTVAENGGSCRITRPRVTFCFLAKDFFRVLGKPLLGITCRLGKTIDIIDGIHQPVIEPADKQTETCHPLCRQLVLEQLDVTRVKELRSGAEEEDHVAACKEVTRPLCA